MDTDWTAPNRYQAFGVASRDGSGGQVSMSASLYLLVKYSEISPKSFICGSRTTSIYRNYGWTARTKEVLEEGITEFRPAMYDVPAETELIDFWHFGPDPTRHISYAYHMVYEPGRMTTSGEPDKAIAADRNPWMDSPSREAGDFSKFKPDIPPYNGTGDEGRCGNTVAHRGAGQNVLFLDGNVEFAKRSFCGLDDDNIYAFWDEQDKARGTPPVLGSQPADPNDSLLVNDPAVPRR